MSTISSKYINFKWKQKGTFGCRGHKEYDTWFWLLRYSLVNVKHMQNIVHSILLLRVDNLTFDKSIYISQQQHHYGLSVLSAFQWYQCDKFRVDCYLLVVYKCVAVSLLVAFDCVFICIDIFTVYIFITLPPVKTKLLVNKTDRYCIHRFYPAFSIHCIPLTSCCFSGVFEMFFQHCTSTQRVFLSVCVCFRVQYIYSVCFSLSYSCISFSAEVWNQPLAMQLHPLVGRGPVHQRTIIAYPSPLVAQKGRMTEKSRLSPLQNQKKKTAWPYHDRVDRHGR